MKMHPLQLIALCLCSMAFKAAATTYYVDINSPNPTPPYTNWSTAATNIQDAIDAATNGDLVLVTNGIYATGGHPVNGFSLTNRVAVTKPVTLQSVNGPAVTTIQGYQVPSNTNGNSAVRCVYITNNAVLIGFTLTNGATRNAGNQTNEACGGGLWAESASAIASNCVFNANSAFSDGGGAYSGTLYNCTLCGNKAVTGGGAFYCNLNNCVLTGNASAIGGGAAYSILFDCIVTNNSAWSGGGTAYGSMNSCTIASNSSQAGGGAYSGTLIRCAISNNLASPDGTTGGGGGAAYATLFNCTINGNSTIDQGGGVYACTLTNCIVKGNSAEDGGGAYDGAFDDCVFAGNFAYGTGGGEVGSGRLNNCTIVSNAADYYGGGVGDFGLEKGFLTNCIVYDNAAPIGANYENETLNYCCTLPVPPNGTDNITNDPLLDDLANNDFHLQSNSPCINSGNNAYITTPTDLDGNPRIVGGTVDIGAYEYQTPTSVISYAYLQQYGLPTDGSVDFANLDGTAFNVYQDWIAGLNPTNSASVLSMLKPVTMNTATGVTVTWQSASGIPYFLQRSTNLASQPPFSIIRSSITGQSNTTSYADTSATNGVPYFYRVGVVAP